MKTKDLEIELGLSKHTIRYYEQEGFIHPQRDDNGYRNYSDQDLQVLKLVKFLRNLNIPIDDVKAIVEGKLNFQECLKVNQIHLDKQIEEMKVVKQTVDYYKDKNIPLIPSLIDVEANLSHNYLGLQKTTQTVSLGRKLTRPWAIRQMIYGLISSLMMSWALSIWFFDGMNLIGQFIGFVVLTVVVEVFIITTAFRQTTTLMLDNCMNQSVEFLNDGIRYYQFTGFVHNLKYFIAVLRGKEQKYMHYYHYEDIKKVKVKATRRYMKIGTPIAYDIFVPDFLFEFCDGTSFYFYWPMILDDDAQFIAHILENKVKKIEDNQNILYAMKNSIHLNDYLKTE